MNFAAIQSAADLLRPHVHVTPVLTSQTLNRRCGAEIFLKCENLQRGGAFKFRGASHAIRTLSPEQQRRGIITFSSGNHGQAVAMVGRELGLKTIVVMPHNAPATKREATAGYGAMVVGCEPAERETVARRLQAEHGCTLIPPYDHEAIIAGQGTATVEFLAQAGPLDALLVPVGGGGLISGTALAAKYLCPGCKVIGVEPASGDDATRSFQTKSLQVAENCLSIADGTRTRSLGNLTFPLVLKHVDAMVTVSEEAIMEAVRFLFYRQKLVVEPSGALGVAALLSGAWSGSGRVGVLLSGGNVDGPTMIKILSAA